MNKKILIVISLVALIFISCNDDEATVVKNGSSTISGVATCQLDLTNSGEEYVPAGTKIIATINTQDLVNSPNANITYPNRTFTTTIGDNGKYSLTVDANVKTVTVNITGSDFEYDQVIGVDTYSRKVYSCSPTTVTVVDGVSKIEDLYFQ